MTGLVCLLLAALVWTVFGQTIHFEFVNYDDSICIYKNPLITQGLTWQGVVCDFTRGSFEAWYPLTDLSHQLDWQLYGSHAGGHHLTNVLLHAATAIVLFLVLRKFTKAFWRPAFVAALFAIHPLRVESVAWVVERKDVLSGLFFMLTLWAWAKHWAASVKNLDAARFRFGWTRWYFLALVFFTFGLLAKSMIVTLPFVLLLLDAWPLRRLPAENLFISRHSRKAWLGLVLEKTPFFFLSAVFCIVTVMTQHEVVSLTQNLTVTWRIGNALQTYVDYLGHMIWPVGLTVAYTDSSMNPTFSKNIIAILILSTVTLGALFAFKKRPYLAVGWLWYLGMLLPTVDLMQLTHNARADRYTYLPQIGLAILLAWGAGGFLSFCRCRRSIVAFAAAMFLIVLAVCAHIQTSYWKNSVTLWTRSLACNPTNSYAHTTLGEAFADLQNWPEAAAQFQQTLQLRPDYSDAWRNLGVACVNQNQHEKAIACFEQALQISPRSADAHYSLGDALANEGKNDDAIRHFEQALRYRPDYPEADYDWGLTLAREGKWDEARSHYERAMHSQLDAADTRYISGVALATQKKWDEASQLYAAALQLKPDFAEAHYRLGIALDAEGKPAEALSHLQQALSLATQQGNSTLAESIRNEIKNHEAAQPH